jgi:hypothetical protein
MIYTNIPVYKTSYDLLHCIFEYTSNFSREYKYTIGEDLKKEILEMIKNIYRANSSFQKHSFLQNARENVEIIRVYLRLLKDLKQISLNKFIMINEKIESVSKQLTRWQQSCSK